MEDTERHPTDSRTARGKWESDVEGAADRCEIPELLVGSKGKARGRTEKGTLRTREAQDGIGEQR